MTPITRACATAWAHIGERTLADATREEIRACIQAPEVCELTAELEVVCLAGELAPVQTLLQQINRAYQRALVAVRQQVAA